jgi:hypothetical protein
MAQVQSPTVKLYEDNAQKIIGVGGNSLSHIALDTGNMSSFTENTNALANECGVSGLSRAAATLSLRTITNTNDTAQAYKYFVAGGTATITGFGVFDSASGGNLQMWCALAASYPVVAGDKLIVVAKAQYKSGS